MRREGINVVFVVHIIMLYNGERSNKAPPEFNIDFIATYLATTKEKKEV